MPGQGVGSVKGGRVPEVRGGFLPIGPRCHSNVEAPASPSAPGPSELGPLAVRKRCQEHRAPGASRPRPKNNILAVQGLKQALWEGLFLAGEAARAGLVWLAMQHSTQPLSA